MSAALSRRISRAWKRLAGGPTIHGHIDASSGNRLSGWAFAEKLPVTLEAEIDGRCVARATPSVDRQDVALAHPSEPNALRSGFVLQIPQDAVPSDRIFELNLTVAVPRATGGRKLLGRFTSAGTRLVETLSAAPASGIVGPFPRAVIDAVASISPEACIDLGMVGGQKAFLAAFGKILQAQELRTLPAIADYARYLRINWSHCGFVDDFFPTRNLLVDSGAADFHCKPNSVFEIFAIIHQLYVARSYGIEGDFAEFGCFKGFSSSMLSFACAQLGLKMHIFDSFEGLPPAAGSGYEAGQYRGGLEEVKANVARFGSIDVVEFHPGFFADTFRTYRPPPLMGLWMDVDLEVSARDLLVVADRLDPRATLFSHECTVDMFREDGGIETVARADNPIAPTLDRFEQLGRPLAGRFMRGNTGAFWARDGGIPALENAVLLELVHIVNSL